MENIIHQYGWLHYSQLQPNDFNEQYIGRIQSVQKTNYKVLTLQGSIRAELSGQLRYATEPSEWPQTGDWVEIIPYDAQCIIKAVLPRYSALARKESGKTSQKQMLAANIDQAILVQGLDRDFNPRRLERLVTALNDASIRPIIVLNKADLALDSAAKKALIERRMPHCPVYLASALHRQGLPALIQTLRPSSTSILIGSSGAGKSTLVNALLGSSEQKTAALSEAVGKGMHTTTNRELFALPNNSLVIDTAGIREFGLTLEDVESVEASFTTIDALAKNCYYADCTHSDEPGCAVLEALANKRLNPDVYTSFIKLRNETEHYRATLQEKKRKGKDISRLVRNMKRHNIKKKY